MKNPKRTNSSNFTSNNTMINKGDIVWARIHYPNTWLPALVLSTNHQFGISLSFFNNTTIQIPRTFYLQSEILPFEEAFPSLISNSRNDTVSFRQSLHDALKVFGLRVVSSLRCRCEMGEEIVNGLGCDGFDSVRVLGFVLDVAVLSWVEDSRVLDAVRVVAQVNAFRNYSSFHHKKIYRESLKKGDYEKQHSCSSLGQKIHSVTQESIALEPEDQIISTKGEENIAIGTISRLKSTVSVLDGSSEQFSQNKLLTISEAPTTNGNVEILTRSPALGLFHIWVDGLKLDSQSLLRFKDMLHHGGTVDIFFRNGSMMSKTQFYISSNFEAELSNCISKRNDSAEGLCCRLPDVETTIHLNRKRKQFDEQAYFSKYTRPRLDNHAYIPKCTRPRISRIKFLEPEESIQKDNRACTHSWETNMNVTAEAHVDLKRSQDLTLSQSYTSKSSSNLAHAFHSDNNYEVDASATKVKCALGSYPSVYQKRMQRSCNGDITSLKSKESAKIEVNIASCSTFNSKGGQQSKTHVPSPYTSLYMKFPRNFNLPSKGQLIKKFSVFGSIDSSKTRVCWYTGSAQVVFYQELDAVAAYQIAKRKALFGKANVRFWLDSFKHKSREIKLTPPSIGPPLKPCLKKSNSLKQESRKKPYRVRFTIET